MEFFGAISTKEEFFYPDTAAGKLPDSLEIDMPQNGMPGIQLLLKTDCRECCVRLDSGDFSLECFRMHSVPVEYNTGNGEDQGGAMVLADRPEKKPDYVTRKAPFRVYDCLEPSDGTHLVPENGILPVYLCLRARKRLRKGTYRACLHAAEYICWINVRVYEIMIPERTFPVTNWFSIEAIERFHHTPAGSSEFLGMLRKYADLMARIHQNVFYLVLDRRCIVSRDPWKFDFSHLEPMIETFLNAGLDTLETGPLLSRGFRADGSPDMYTDRFTCAMAPEIPVDTPEGYEVTVRFVQDLAAFLKGHGWDKKVLFHVQDEPDIHCPPEALESRKKQYYLAVSVLRKYLPDVRIIEAVSSAEFRGGVDIWVPGTPGYEAHREEFDRLIRLGEQVWTYVCCGPEGNWLNRFLDFALIKGRLLFWGCARNRISGFLHWGFNQFPGGMNPFQGTSCPNETGIGTSFPCGDSFLVYPGKDGPWPGMRMEAARRGAEDAALLQLLRERDPAAHERLTGKMFRSNHEYNEDPEEFQHVYRQLLELLEQTEG